jgi:hypothetical protein
MNTPPCFHVKGARYHELCGNCVSKPEEGMQHTMLSTYSLQAMKCCQCGRLADLAFVKVEKKEVLMKKV